MHSIKIVILVASIVFFDTIMLYSQNFANDSSFEIKVNLIGVDNNCKKPKYFNYYSILSLTNRRDTTVQFWIMSSSWLKYNWITNNDSISILYPGSDFDNPQLIKLLPHKSIKFYAVLEAKEEFINKFFQIGFLYYDDTKTFFSRFRESDKINKKKYWSKPIRLRSKLNRFEIE